MHQHHGRALAFAPAAPDQIAVAAGCVDDFGVGRDRRDDIGRRFSGGEEGGEWVEGHEAFRCC